MTRLRRPPGTRRDGWLALKKESRVLLDQGTLAFFRPGAFPGRHKGRVWVAEAHAEEGAQVFPPSAEATWQTFGKWQLRLVVDSDSTAKNGGGSGSSGGASGDRANLSADDDGNDVDAKVETLLVSVPKLPSLTLQQVPDTDSSSESRDRQL